MKYLLPILIISVCVFSCKRKKIASRVSLTDLATIERINFVDSNYLYVQAELGHYDQDSTERGRIKRLDLFYGQIRTLIMEQKFFFKLDSYLRAYKAAAFNACKNQDIALKIKDFSFGEIDSNNFSASICKLNEFHDLHFGLYRELALSRQLKCHSLKDLNPLQCFFERDSAATYLFKISMPGYASCLSYDINSDTIYLDGKLHLGLITPKKDYSICNVQLYNVEKDDYEVNGTLYYDLGYEYKELPFNYSFSKR